MSADRQWALDNLALYVLGLLDSDEASKVELIAKQDHVVGSELQDMLATTTHLARVAATTAAPSRIADRLMTSIGHGRFESFVPRMSNVFDVDASRMREILGLIDRRDSWQPQIPGINLIHFEAGPACKGADTGFVQVAPGVTFPWHGHEGEELTFVLRGKCKDYSGRIIGPGEEMVLGGGTAHEFSSIGDEPLLFSVRVFGVRFDVAKQS